MNILPVLLLHIFTSKIQFLFAGRYDILLLLSILSDSRIMSLHATVI